MMVKHLLPADSDLVVKNSPHTINIIKLLSFKSHVTATSLENHLFLEFEKL